MRLGLNRSKGSILGSGTKNSCNGCIRSKSSSSLDIQPLIEAKEDVTMLYSLLVFSVMCVMVVLVAIGLIILNNLL